MMNEQIERMESRIDTMKLLESSLRECARLYRDIGDNLGAEIMEDDARDMTDDITEARAELNRLYMIERDAEERGRLYV